MHIFAVWKNSRDKAAFEMFGMKFDMYSNCIGALSYVDKHRFVSQWPLRDTPTCVITYHATADLFC